MTLQNRVTPSGEIVAVAARGSLMGNRGGRIHDPASRRLTGSRWASRQWICCVLAFKDRHRTVMGPGYTELFFLDEATALAAGHRPCFECRRGDALRFAEAMAEGLGVSHRPSAPQMDYILHGQRLEGRHARRHRVEGRNLADGAMVEIGGEAWIVAGTVLRRWTPDGYRDELALDPRGRYAALTPPATLAALLAGYQPATHPSAGPGFRQR
ncbi:MAG: hypothetical protein AB7L41_10715 [Flavobacteriaceae bacterium]